MDRKLSFSVSLLIITTSYNIIFIYHKMLLLGFVVLAFFPLTKNEKNVEIDRFNLIIQRHDFKSHIDIL